MISKHKLNLIKFHKSSNETVSERQIVEQIKGLPYN